MEEPVTTPCGCCAGVDTETPARIDNNPGQTAIQYRIGTHGQFLESLLARLSSAELPALASLRRRDGGDMTIALCDALATSLDVLTFHSERIANEIPLRTATELRSLQELARLIGYRPAPGLAASTWLAFTLQEAPADPALSAGPVPIPVGTRVQSVPGPGEEAQTFETVEVIEARSEWNAVPVQTQRAWQPQTGDTSLWLEGLGLRLVAGDVVLLVGRERSDSPGSPRWDLRLLTAVVEDWDRQRTRVSWEKGLAAIAPPGQSPDSGCSVYVFRQRAGLFGHNAPDRRLLKLEEDGTGQATKGPKVTQNSTSSMSGFITQPLEIQLNPSVVQPKKTSDSQMDSREEWQELYIQDNEIDLDAAYASIVPDSWVALVSSTGTSHPSGLAGAVELFRASSVAFPSRRDFGLSARITRIQPDTPPASLDPFRNRLRETLVLAQSERLAVRGRPLGTPLYGDVLVLARPRESIGPGHVVALRGKAARVRLRSGISSAVLATAGGGSVLLQEGDSLRLISPPEQWLGGTPQALDPERFGALLADTPSAELRLHLLDRDGTAGRLTVVAGAVELVAAEADDPVLQEIAIVATPLHPDPPDRDNSHFRLQAGLRHAYDRESLRVNLNVAPATHGETVSEVLGSGDARRRNLRFPLRQGPLTHVSSAASPSGRRSTLELRVNDLLWPEVPTLYGRGGSERVHALEWDATAGTRVLTGDGSEGAWLPSGVQNIRARYRKGLGVAGNVAAGRLTTLLSRPLGVSEVVNPEPAEGGEDPESLERLRVRAPLTVRTLDRAVSVRDYHDFARAFPGIAKAHVLWVPHGEARGVSLTVAGEKGREVSANQAVYGNLLTALRRYGDPLVPLRLQSFDPAVGWFRLRLAVKVAADAEPALVHTALAGALTAAFGFEARELGQAVWIDEVAAVAQGVAGVEALVVKALHRADAPVSRQNRLIPHPPLAAGPAAPWPAELLRLEPGSLVLEPLP